MNLDDWRSRINDLDNRILQLLNQRAEAALQIGDLKRRQDAPAYAPEREAEIFRRLTAAAAGPLSSAAVVAVWREILSACRALESPLTVAYLGPQATFTHQAALQRFGAAVVYRPARSISEVFDDVERRRADFGVVPVENSTEGAVNVTLDRLIDCAFQDVRDNDRRIRCYHRANQVIADERYVIGLIQTQQLWGISTRLRYTPRIDNHIFGAEFKRAQ